MKTGTFGYSEQLDDEIDRWLLKVTPFETLKERFWPHLTLLTKFLVTYFIPDEAIDVPPIPTPTVLALEDIRKEKILLQVHVLL